MSPEHKPKHVLGRPLAVASLMMAMSAISACTSPDALTGSGAASSGGSGTFRERMSSMLFGGAPASAPAAAATAGAADPADLECPTVTVRSGTGTLSASVAGAEPSATNLRYQVTIGQMARECAALGATMTIKVGVQGRVILGPAGGPGQIEVPMRLALVREGPEPKTVWTKLYRVPVTIPEGQSNVPFLHIEEDLTFPLPTALELEAYIIYVGFDPLGLKEQRRPAKQKRRSS